MIYKILRQFVNTSTADDKHYLLNRENLTEGNEMQFYQKQKTFSQFFSEFLKPMVMFKHFPKSDDPHG